jgi:uncharacterized iron-regulated membrane protein
MTFRKALFWTHLCVGVTAGLVILSMSVTGVLIAFEHEIVDFAERKVRSVSVPAPDAQRLSLDTLRVKAQEVYPEGKPSGISLRPGPEASVAIGFGRDGAVYVDPYTGEVLGKGSKVHDWMHEIVDFHRWMGSREKGRPITGAANLAFFGLAISGLYLWLQKSVFKFQKNAKGKARDWNWHNVIGFWSAPFLVIITLTGSTISYTWATNLVYRLAGSPPPPPRPASPPSPLPPGEGGPPKVVGEAPLASLDTFFTHAQTQQPEWKAIMIRLPQKPGAPVVAMIQEPGGTFPRRSQLTMDAATGEIKKWEPVSEWNRGRQWRTWARYLHTGEAGGILGQFIAMLASAGAVVLVWTGLALAWRRYRSFISLKKAK